MKICKYCKKEIDSIADICPHCHQKQKDSLHSGAKALIIIFAIILCLGVLGNLFDDDKEKPKLKGDNKETKETSKDKVFSIGDVIQYKDYEITIENVKTATEVGGEYFKSNPAEGGIYVCVDYTIKNISDEPMSSFSFPSVRLQDSKGTKYSQDISASSYYATEMDPDRKILSDLNPGITVSDNDVFEISKDSYESSGWNLLIDNKFKVKIK